jgi:hypothetical protein
MSASHTIPGLPKAPKYPESFESKLTIAFKEVLEAGLPKTAGKGEKVYIDIAHLWGHWVEFFNRRGDKDDGGHDNLAHWIDAKLKDIPPEAIPVVRILIGGSANITKSEAWKILKGDVETLFWPGSNCKDLLKSLAIIGISNTNRRLVSAFEHSGSYWLLHPKFPSCVRLREHQICTNLTTVQA